MDFGEAVRALKSGKRVSREGWNGKGMWLVLIRRPSCAECGCQWAVGPEDLCWWCVMRLRELAGLRRPS